MKQIKFHYKEKSFSCGPCALRMVLETILNTEISEDVIIELIGSNKDIGTPLLIFQNNLHSCLNEICILFKLNNHFEFIIKENSNIKELQRLKDEGYLIILNYKKPNGEPHWAVLNDINPNAITLMDPDFGPNFKYKLSEFNWNGGISTPTSKAIIAIRYNS